MRRSASAAVTVRSPRIHSRRVKRSCVTSGCAMGQLPLARASIVFFITAMPWSIMPAM